MSAPDGSRPSARDPGPSFRTREQRLVVQTSASLQCGFCGQVFEIEIARIVGPQHFTTDCEVCCRPMEVTAATPP